MRLLCVAQGGLLVLALFASAAVVTGKGLNESFQASAVLSPAPAHQFMSLLVRPPWVPVSVDLHLWSIRNLRTCAPSRRLVPWPYLPFVIALWRCTPMKQSLHACALLLRPLVFWPRPFASLASRCWLIESDCPTMSHRSV